MYVGLYFLNPLPGLHVLQTQAPYSKVDEDYHKAVGSKWILGGGGGGLATVKT